MLIKTEKFGDVEINKEYIFNFVKPIIGFEKLDKYVLIEHDESSPFKWLQSVQEPALAFPITSASYFDIDYQFELNDEDINTLRIKTEEDLLILNIVSIPVNQPQNSTINLLSPIVINFTNKNAMQIILQNTNYTTRKALFADTATTEN